MSAFLITDVGSTTTKAILIAEVNGEYRLIDRAEAPTTVEEPFEDVNIGVRDAIEKLERVTGKKLLGADSFTAEDITYYTSSSAGGGLQVLVIGLYSKVTAASASKAALGAGAILLDTISSDDTRPVYEKIDALRQARPDMILLTGGIDGGSVDYALEFADIINSANPKPRFGTDVKLPVIYAGNVDAAQFVEDTLSADFDLHIVPNLRPQINKENLSPTRDQIHELFLSHVMQQAPGYRELSEKAHSEIVPTPKAVGSIMSILANREDYNILGMDIGGATTDVFSVLNGEFHRTVSANLGMSYSLANVLEQTGPENIMRHLPFEITEQELGDAVATKMLFPTTLPVSIREIMIEQAAAREALRIAVEHHQELITALPGLDDGWPEFFKTEAQRVRKFTGADSLLDMSKIGLVIGSGGVLSHAPRRQQAAMMLLDSAEFIGVTKLAVDSIFMMPHLGVLGRHYPEIALDVLMKDCFIPLGSAISGRGKVSEKEIAVTVNGTIGGEYISRAVSVGDMAFFELGENESATIEVIPHNKVDIGAGEGVVRNFTVSGGRSGLIIDMRKTVEGKYSKEDLERWLVESGSFTPEELQAAREV